MAHGSPRHQMGGQRRGARGRWLSGLRVATDATGGGRRCGHGSPLDGRRAVSAAARGGGAGLGGGGRDGGGGWRARLAVWWVIFGCARRSGRLGTGGERCGAWGAVLVSGGRARRGGPGVGVVVAAATVGSAHDLTVSERRLLSIWSGCGRSRWRQRQRPCRIDPGGRCSTGCVGPRGTVAPAPVRSTATVGIRWGWPVRRTPGRLLGWCGFPVSALARWSSSRRGFRPRRWARSGWGCGAGRGWG
jgi:hypothetical protein